MAGYALLMEMTHAIISSKSLMEKIGTKITEAFFEGNYDLYFCLDIVRKEYDSNGMLPSKGYVTDKLCELSNSDKKAQNLFQGKNIVDFVETIFASRYNIDFIEGQIFEEYARAKIIDITNDVVDRMNLKEKVSIESVMQLYNKVAIEIKSMTTAVRPNEFDLELDELHEQMVRNAVVDSMVETGFPILDSLIDGLKGGEIGVFVAPPNRGKTAWLGAFARNMVLRGQNLLFISGETHVEDLRKRFWAAQCDVAINQLKDINPMKLEYSLIGLQRVGGKMVMEDFISNDHFTALDLEAMIGKYIQSGFYPDVIVLDYFDLMKPSTKGNDGNYRLQLNEIYRDVRRVSAHFNIPIWTASQTNREGSSTILITEKVIGEDFQKICNADKIVTFNQTAVEQAKNIGRLHIMKTRNSAGKNVAILVKTFFDRMRFHEVKQLSFEEHMKIMRDLSLQLRIETSKTQDFKKKPEFKKPF